MTIARTQEATSETCHPSGSRANTADLDHGANDSVTSPQASIEAPR